MLLPVLATMLQFSPAEVAKCQEASSRADTPAGASRNLMRVNIEALLRRTYV